MHCLMTFGQSSVDEGARKGNGSSPTSKSNVARRSSQSEVAASNNDDNNNNDNNTINSSGNNSTNSNQMKQLLKDFKPGQFDVICARGKQARDHSGNRRFRYTIESNLDKYLKATNKIAKSVIVTEIIESVRRASPDGGFVRFEEGRWYEVGDHAAREKVGQCLRDRLHTFYKSSSKAKKQRSKDWVLTESEMEARRLEYQREMEKSKASMQVPSSNSSSHGNKGKILSPSSSSSSVSDQPGSAI